MKYLRSMKLFEKFDKDDKSILQDEVVRDLMDLSLDFLDIGCMLHIVVYIERIGHDRFSSNIGMAKVCTIQFTHDETKIIWEDWLRVDTVEDEYMDVFLAMKDLVSDNNFIYRFAFSPISYGRLYHNTAYYNSIAEVEEIIQSMHPDKNIKIG